MLVMSYEFSCITVVSGSCVSLVVFPLDLRRDQDKGERSGTCNVVVL